MNIVISQPMLFPWVGLFEQIRLADIYVHYVDVQFSKGSFTNRVQVKVATGSEWLTIPVRHEGLGMEIRNTRINLAQPWQRKHLQTLRQAYAKAPHATDMLALVESVYAHNDDNIGALAIRGIEAVCDYFGLAAGKRFLQSPDLETVGSGSERVLSIVQRLGGSVYVTGHGARNYLQHQLFEKKGIEVRYMDYAKTPYPQLHGEFTPYVTILDLIANTGPRGRDFIHSGTKNWREFVQ